MGMNSSKNEPVIDLTSCQNELDTKIKSENKVSDYDYLVCSGGGIKGVSYCGAMKILNDCGIDQSKMKGFAGTSAGACVVGLLAVGYTTEELTCIMADMDTDDVFDDKFGVIRDTMNLVEKYGIAPGKFIYNLLGDLIEAKTGSADYTIEQLYLDKKIKLVIVGTDMNTSKSRYFHPESLIESDRKISIRKAIRISMSLPYLFEPVVHLDHLHVDGGVLDNYPIHVFDGAYPGDFKARIGSCRPNTKVLGLRILAESDAAILHCPEKNPEKISSLIDYSMAFLRTFMTENDRRTLIPAHTSRTITIITPDYDMSNFSLSTEDKKTLIKAGMTHTINFFNLN